MKIVSKQKSCLVCFGSGLVVVLEDDGVHKRYKTCIVCGGNGNRDMLNSIIPPDNDPLNSLARRYFAVREILKG